jgi:hypothetical protein
MFGVTVKTPGKGKSKLSRRFRAALLAVNICPYNPLFNRLPVSSLNRTVILGGK